MKKTKLQFQYLEYDHIQILEQFNKGFHQVYRHMEPEKRIALFDLAPMLFQKWYSCALVSETILSPANIISSDERLGLSENEIIAYTLTVNKSQKPGSNFSFHSHVYTTDNHPLVLDMKTILEYCQPDISLEGKGKLTPSDTALLLPKLSQQNPAYLDYLILLCWRMGFLSRLSSINSARMQPVSFDSFFALPTCQQLSQLAHEALKLAVQQIQDSMRLGFDFISEDFFMPYLESAQDVDELFIDIFQMLDVDITNIWEQASVGSLSSDEASIMSSFYYMGALLDKWFITPMSHYFYCLQPLYYTPFPFISTINNLTSLLIMESETDMELYSPCSHYRQTPIGKAVFGARDDEEQEQHLIPSYIEFDQIIATLDHAIHQEKLANKKKGKPKEELVYTFKIKYTAFKRKWKIVEVYARVNLETFCDQLCEAFCLDDVMDYTLTIWDHNQYPLTFSPEKSKRSINKAHTNTLEGLSLEVGDRMMFTPIPNKNKQLELELTLLKAGANNPFIVYPRIKKQSSFITEAEKTEDLF